MSYRHAVVAGFGVLVLGTSCGLPKPCNTVTDIPPGSTKEVVLRSEEKMDIICDPNFNPLTTTVYTSIGTLLESCAHKICGTNIFSNPGNSFYPTRLADICRSVVGVDADGNPTTDFVTACSVFGTPNPDETGSNYVNFISRNSAAFQEFARNRELLMRREVARVCAIPPQVNCAL